MNRPDKEKFGTSKEVKAQVAKPENKNVFTDQERKKAEKDQHTRGGF